MFDWGLYDALRTKDDFAQQRQDHSENLQYIAAMNKQSQDQLAAEQAAQQGVNEHLKAAQDAITAAHPADQQRIRDYYNSILDPLKDKIANYNGNLAQWKMGGGAADLDQFNNALQYGKDERGSNPVMDAVANMNQYRQLMADQKSGLTPRSNPDGTPFDIAKQLADLQAGKVNTLAYPGAYKRQKYDLNDLTNTYGQNRYVREPVSKQELIQHMHHQGLDPEQIKEDLPTFFDAKGNSTVFHKYDTQDPLTEQYKRMQVANLQSEINARNNGGGGGSGDNENNTDLLANRLHAIVSDNPDAWTTIPPKSIADVFREGRTDYTSGDQFGKKISYILDGTIVGKRFIDANNNEVPAGTPGAKADNVTIITVEKNNNKKSYTATLSDGGTMVFDAKNAGSKVFDPALKFYAGGTKSVESERKRAVHKGWETGTGIGQWDKADNATRSSSTVQDYGNLFK